MNDQIPAHLLERARAIRQRQELEERPPDRRDRLDALIEQLTEARERSRDARNRARAANEEAMTLQMQCDKLRSEIIEIVDDLVDPPTVNVIPKNKPS